jgi:hypothetical protein
MKQNLMSFVRLFTVTVLFAAAGCSDRSRKESDPVAGPAGATRADASGVTAAPALLPSEPTGPVIATAVSPDPFADITFALDSSTRDTTASLSTPQEAMDRAIDAHIAAGKANGATSTSVDDGKLTLARTDFAQKLRTLTLASEDTWQNAKREAQSSLQNLRRVLGEYLTGRARN